jgi:hypothetical protein
MARTKTPDEFNNSPSLYPENMALHSWGNETPEFQIEKDRGYKQYEDPHFQKMIYEGTFHMRPDWIIPGYQLGWIMERVLNQPDYANVQKRLNMGWEPVRKEECHWLHHNKFPDLINVGGDDPYVRNSGQILMKIPQELYNHMQDSHWVEGKKIEKESLTLTNYMSNRPQDPRSVNIFDSSGKYDPNFVARR